MQSSSLRSPLLITTVLLTLPLQVNAAKKLDGDALLDREKIIEVRIDLPQQDWDKLRRQERDRSTAFSGLPTKKPYTYFKADITIDGRKIESVGIRKKGFFGSVDSQRPSLKVKFDEYVDQDPVKGLSRLTLNNNKQDRSLASQFLTYELFRRAGNPAPRSNWAHVIVNGESLGVYSHVESIKKPFLQHSFGNKSGNLYEGTLTDFHPKALTNIEVKTNEEENRLDDIRRLAELIAAEGDLDAEALNQIIDVESFYRFWALESLTGFWDGYSANQNNYYLYFNPDDGRGRFIPWGADWVMSSRSPFSFGGGNQGTSVMYSQSLLSHRLYHSDGGSEKYQATLRALLEDAWDEDQMLADLDRIEKLVTPHLHQSQESAPQGMDEVRGFIRGRRAAVESALKDWRPDVAPEPRTPAYLVDVGTLAGTFSARFAGGPDDDGSADVKVELSGDAVPFETVTARIQPVPQFGGFGGGRRGGSRGGFGGNRGGFGNRGGNENNGPNPPPQNTDGPLNLTLTGTPREGQPVTITVRVERNTLKSVTNEPVEVSGSYREGRSQGFGGFGGFGGGPSRNVIGSIVLTETGIEPGDQVAGKITLRVVETRGGFFQQRRRGNNRGFGGGFGGQRGGGQPQGGFGPPQRGGGPPQGRFGPPAGNSPASLMRVLDRDNSGDLSESEIKQASETLRTLDRNKDGRVSAEELLPEGRRPEPGPGGGPRRSSERVRPQLEDDAG